MSPMTVSLGSIRVGRRPRGRGAAGQAPPPPRGAGAGRGGGGGGPARTGGQRERHAGDGATPSAAPRGGDEEGLGAQRGHPDRGQVAQPVEAQESGKPREAGPG